MSLKLYRHNQDAYNRVAELLSATGRAAVIHPTGTGKSYIAFKLIEANHDASFLWLSPSRYIIDTQQANLQREMPEFDISHVQFMTYAKLILLPEDEMRWLGCDYIVLDEFHRCGADQWGQGVLRLLEMYPDAKCLGLTATNIRYLDAGRDMAEELFGDNIASEMSLGEAIVRGILPQPEYITSIYKYSAELEEYQRRIDTAVPKGIKGKVQKQLETLRRSLENAQQLDALFAEKMRNKRGKYIIFCSSWEHLQEVREHVNEWFRLVDDAPRCYVLYSGEAATEQEYAAFCGDESDHLKLMLCINRLNEGVHVADLSGVILFRPTVSPIIYKQQIGRALTAGGRMPVIFDIVGNFDNLLSISSIQHEMASAVEYLRESGRADEIVVDRFEIDGRTLECVEMIRWLEQSINSHWEDYYAAAERYFAENGDLLIQHRYVTPEGLQLGAWIWTQRSLYKSKGHKGLSEEQIAQLERIGMVWQGVHEYDWEQAYSAAQAYFEKHGNLNVSVNYRTDDGFALGVWLNNQRQRVNGNARGRKLSQERIERLNSIGMVWELRNNAWETHYAEAKAYFEAHGNLNIPSDYRTEDGFLLGMWVMYQRKSATEKKNSLTMQQKKLLEAIGMSWEPEQDQRWMRAYRAACAYYEQNGDLDVPYAYKTDEGLALGRWLSRQRDARQGTAHCNCRLNEKRVQMLDAINMSWSGRQKMSK